MCANLLPKRNALLLFKLVNILSFICKKWLTILLSSVRKVRMLDKLRGDIPLNVYLLKRVWTIPWVLSNLSNNSSLLQILRNVLATLNWILPIVPLVSKGVGRWSVTETTSLPKLSGTASQVQQEQGCQLRLLPYIIVEPMHRAGWMVNIRRRRMGLFRGRFASTGAITFVHGTCLSVSVTVETSSCII